MKKLIILIPIAIIVYLAAILTLSPILFVLFLFGISKTFLLTIPIFFTIVLIPVALKKIRERKEKLNNK